MSSWHGRGPIDDLDTSEGSDPMWIPPPMPCAFDDISILSNDVPIEQVLSHESIITAYRDGNLDVVRHLTQPEMVRRMLVMLSEGTDKSQLKVIFQLFASSNRQIIKVMMDDHEMSDLFIQIFTKRDPNYLFNVALATRIITESVKDFSFDVIDMLEQQHNVFSVLLDGIMIDSIYAALIDLVEKAPMESSVFLWGFFMAVFKDHETDFFPSQLLDFPISCFQACKDVMLTPQHKTRVIHLFTEYCQNYSEETEMKEYFINNIPDLIETESDVRVQIAILNFSTLFGPGTHLRQFCLKVLQNGTVGSKLTESSLAYLCCDHDESVVGYFIYFIYKLFSPYAIYHIPSDIPVNDRASNFIFERAYRLFRILLQYSKNSCFLLKAIQHILVWAWNNKAGYGFLIYRTYLLKFSTIIANNTEWESWLEFYNEVITLYYNNIQYPIDFIISQENFDEELFRSIQNSQISFEIKPEEQGQYKAKNLSMFHSKSQSLYIGIKKEKDASPLVPQAVPMVIPTIAPRVKKINMKAPTRYSPDFVHPRPKAHTPKPIVQKRVPTPIPRENHKKKVHRNTKEEKCNLI